MSRMGWSGWLALALVGVALTGCSEKKEQVGAPVGDTAPTQTPEAPPPTEAPPAQEASDVEALPPINPDDPFYKVTPGQYFVRFLEATEATKRWGGLGQSPEFMRVEVMSPTTGKLTLEIWDRSHPTEIQAIGLNGAPETRGLEVLQSDSLYVMGRPETRVMEIPIDVEAGKPVTIELGVRVRPGAEVIATHLPGPRSEPLKNKLRQDMPELWQRPLMEYIVVTTTQEGSATASGAFIGVGGPQGGPTARHRLTRRGGDEFTRWGLKGRARLACWLFGKSPEQLGFECPDLGPVLRSGESRNALSGWVNPVWGIYLDFAPAS